MNKKIFIIALILAAIISIFGFYIGGRYINQKILNLSLDIFQEIITNEADVLTSVTRNDFILGNTKLAKVVMEKALIKSGIQKISVWNVPQTYHDVVGDISEDNIFFEVTKNIYFGSENSSQKWGEIHFFISKAEFQNFSERVYFLQMFVLTPIFIFLFILFILIIYMFGKSSLFLNSIFDYEEVESQCFSRLEILFWGDLISKINKAKLKLISTINEKNRLKSEASLIDLSKQVAHDIRSPLSALNMVLGSLEGYPIEKQALIKNATFRINEIANDLLLNAKNNQNKMKSSNQFEDQNSTYPNLEFKPIHSSNEFIFSTLVQEIVSEKRIQFLDKKNLQIKSDLLLNNALCLKVDPSKVSRIVSNLVNNSVDACNSVEGEVVISVREYPDFVQLIVSDNGSGIPPEILDSIGTKGFTTKLDGNGLGLFHAKQLVEEMGGQFSILSKIGMGTFVTLQFPLHESR